MKENEIRRIRFALHMTQVKFAKKIGVTQTILSLWESDNANRRPSIGSAIKIIKFALANKIDTSLDKIYRISKKVKQIS